VAVSVRECFLNNAEDRSLQAHGKLVPLAVGRQLRDESGAIGKTIDIAVTTVLQTTAGKMIFGRYDDRVHQVYDTRQADKPQQSPRDREHSGATANPGT